MSILRKALSEATMMRWHESVAAGLALLLAAAPILGAPADMLGIIVTANGASNWGADVPAGTTVFSGDQLSTSPTGGVQVRLAAARLQLTKDSIAAMGETDGIPAATLLRGAAVFSTANARGFALNVARAVIRPKSDEPTIGEVAVLGERELLVKCAKGALTITVADDSRVIEEGRTYRVVLDPTPENEAQQQPPPVSAGTKTVRQLPRPAGRSRFLLYEVATATGLVTIVTFLAVQEALESPDRP